MNSLTLKLLIVDDEPIICQGLKMTIPWQGLNVEVIGEAYDGEEALSIIKENHVDIILTDVSMPVMDGLALAENVSNHFPHIHMIFISGYDEFEYAKRAIRLGVRDYLLKPVDIDELIKLVKTIQLELAKDRERQQISLIKQLLSSIVLEQELDFLENTTVNDIGGYQFLCSEMKDCANTMEYMSSDEQLCVKSKWKEKMDEELRTHDILAVSIFMDENQLLTCCKTALEANDIYVEITDSISLLLGIEIRLCYSDVAMDLTEIKKSYQTSLDGIKIAHTKKEHVYNASKICLNHREDDLNKIKIEFNQILHNDKSSFDKFVNNLFIYFEKNSWLLEDVVSSLREIVVEQLTMPIKQPLRLFEDVNVTFYNSYRLIKELFIKDIEDYISYQHSVAGGSQRWLIKKALHYIKEHYASDLKASEVANVINVSPNHFSQIIKQETGKHFNDYLHEVRLHQAKILLKETPYRVFEIAEMVGYKDYKYFVHIFKKCTSTTPTKYRNVLTSLEVEI